MSSSGWIGVDLDGTFAHYEGWKGIEHIGPPIPLMVERVKRWLAEGRQVKIFTARVSGHDAAQAARHINEYLIEHLGRKLPITNIKDRSMIQLWDDRAVGVVFNTGARCDGLVE
jgi:hypothetical protein